MDLKLDKGVSIVEKMTNIGKQDKQMDGTVRSNIKIGSKVMVVQKQDQRTGKLTEGIVMKILTNSQNHPRGIKVMLEGGTVGRVQRICNS